MILIIKKQKLILNNMIKIKSKNNKVISSKKINNNYQIKIMKKLN